MQKGIIDLQETKYIRVISNRKKIVLHVGSIWKSGIVSKDGKITAKKKGSCNIVIYAINGVKTTVKETAK